MCFNSVKSTDNFNIQSSDIEQQNSQVQNKNAEDSNTVDQKDNLNESVNSLINAPVNNLADNQSVNQSSLDNKNANHEVDTLNKVSEELTVLDVVKNCDEKIHVKEQEPYSDEVSSFITDSIELFDKYSNAKTIEAKLVLAEQIEKNLNKIESLLNGLTALQENNEISEKDEILRNFLLDAVEKLKDIKTAITDFNEFAKCLSLINKDPEKTNEQKLEDLRELYDVVKKEEFEHPSDYSVRLDMLAQSTKDLLSVSDTTHDFIAGLNLSDEQSFIFEKKMSDALASMFLNFNSELKDEKTFGVKNIFNSFVEANKEKLSGKTEEQKKLEFVNKFLELTESSNALDLCKRVDDLLLFSNQNLALELKEALSSPKDYNFVHTQHAYKSAFTSLF